MVREAVRGDRESAALLFDHYYPRVYRYALARLGSSADAEDVAAETFAPVLRDLGRFTWRGAGFEAWIFRVASNLVVDHVRQMRRQIPGTMAVSEEDLRPDLGAEGAFGRTESAGDLDELLSRLTPAQREVLLLRFAADLATDEVARVMGRRPNAVRQLQFRALEQMRRMMLDRMETE